MRDIKRQAFVAELHHNFSSKYRGGELTDVVLLTGIKDSDGRKLREDNHTWVNKSDFEEFIPKNTTYSTKVVFQAEEFKYFKIKKDKQVQEKGLREITTVLDKKAILRKSLKEQNILFKLYNIKTKDKK